LAAEWVRMLVCIESDCLTLVRAVNDGQSSRTAWAGVVEEIRDAKQLLQECTLSHVYREANAVAHEFAQRALRYQEWEVLCFAALECVRRLLEIEAVQGNDTQSNCIPPVSN
jgi:hypothetical protein